MIGFDTSLLSFVCEVWRWLRIFSLSIFLYFSCDIASGQNLVPNPGFDDLIYCPDDVGQIHLASPWVSSGGTPEVYNSCSDNPKLKVPNAGAYFDSYQPARSGDGYAGISVYTTANIKGKELLGVSLKEKLKKNKLYYIRFFVSPDLAPSALYWRYTDAIALAFTDTSYYIDIEPNPEFKVPLVPAIENLGKLITDTSGWTKVEGIYIANGTERFVVIGNFRPNSEVLFEQEWDIYGSGVYFYVEDVLVMKFDPLPDTVLLCQGDELVLNAGFLDAKYLWNTGDTDSILQINKEGTYSVEVIMDNCTMRDTTVVLDMRDIGNYEFLDTIICDDDVLNISSPVYGDCIWSTGATGHSLAIDEPGSYELVVTNACGEYRRSISVEERTCNCNVYVPNIFSPNGDGINDHLVSYLDCYFDFLMHGFRIFDRWGNEIYSTNEFESIKWNGTYKGRDVPSGVYTWIMDFDIIRNGTRKRNYATGDITIIR